MTLDDTPDSAAVLTKATLRVAERLGMDDASLARVLNVSVVEVLGYRRGDMAIAPSSPEGGQAVLLIRAFRALDTLGNSDQVTTARLQLAIQTQGAAA